MAEILITELNGNIIGTEDDDVLALDTPVDQPFTGFIDAGAGFDRISVAGDRRIADAALSGIEAVLLAAGARLTVDTLSIGEAPVVEVQGTGGVIVNMSGQNLDARGVSFAPGSSVTSEIHGTGKSDFITATLGNDTVSGGAKADIIKGLAGNDRLFGEQGTDNIQGGEGDDWIDGGPGDDILAGGAGIDTVSYADIPTPGDSTIIVGGGPRVASVPPPVPGVPDHAGVTVDCASRARPSRPASAAPTRFRASRMSMAPMVTTACPATTVPTG